MKLSLAHEISRRLFVAVPFIVKKSSSLKLKIYSISL